MLNVKNKHELHLRLDDNTYRLLRFLYVEKLKTEKRPAFGRIIREALVYYAQFKGHDGKTDKR